MPLVYDAAALQGEGEMDTERLRAAFGPRADYYLKRFEKIERKPGGWSPGWNWAAFLHSTGWFWYRRMYGWSLLNLVAPVLLPAFLLFVVQWFVPEASFGALWAALAAAYLLLVFVLLPMFADVLYYRHLKRRDFEVRRPSFWTALGVLLLIAIPLLLAFVVASAQNEYSMRARVAEGLSIAASLKAPVAEFHAQHRRLPGPEEAKQFAYGGRLKYTASVAWDAGRKAIVVTMADRFSDKRFEMAAEAQGDSVAWTCRTIDLEPKYLPAACR